MLKKMDDLMLFDRSGGVNPYLLGDGHGRCFEEPFLEYIHESNTTWGCCIGVPYGMSLWQLGDSKDQNGMFKIECKKSKAETVRAKIRAGFPAMLERSDIILIVHDAWKESFARVEQNKRATAAQGWGPLKYILLDHPELQETKDRVKSIADLYDQQVKYGVNIVDLTLFNTE
jgi:hypothetical protein